MYRLGIDIGGTFTDLVLMDLQSGERFLGKELTTPADPAAAAMIGVRRILADAGIAAGDLQHVVHGTTLVINAIIEQKGARTALLTTSGFADILEMRRGKRFDMDDLFIEVPTPLVPRNDVREIPERMSHAGEVLEALGEDQTRAVVEELRQIGIESVAVSYLHAYRNSVHERRTREMIEALAPDLPVSISSEVAPDIREYERTSTTVANAYAKPITRRYLDRMQRSLASTGYSRELYLMLSDAALATAETAKAFPIRLLESGPAGGAVTAQYYSRQLDRPNLVAFDMGGTTAKISFISGGRILTTDELETARRHGFKRGSGLPIRTPSVQIMEIGSGGGGIASVDMMGLIKVGPQSAGASPGPAAYGRGGESATVTDANLLLGYLNPDYFLGGRMSLSVDAASKAIGAVAADAGLDMLRTAWGIHEIVTEDMVRATRLHLIERGVDPRHFALLAFGGAGPLHACRLARKLGMRDVFIPAAAGVASAFGFLAAPISFTLVQAHLTPLKGADTTPILGVLRELEQRARDFLTAADVAPADTTIRRFALLRYHGQGSEIRIDIPDGPIDEPALKRLAEAFHAEYQRIYGRRNSRIPVEALNWQVTASGSVPELALPTDAGAPGDADRAPGTRRAYFGEVGEFVETPVVVRSKLDIGTRLDGPVLVEERESTTVIPPGAVLEIDAFRNLHITLSTEADQARGAHGQTASNANRSGETR